MSEYDIEMSDAPIPRQNSIPTQQPISDELTCSRSCRIVTRGCLCHPHLKSFYLVLAIIMFIVLYVIYCFGLTTALYLGIIGESWDDYVKNEDWDFTIIMMGIVAITIFVGCLMGKFCVTCWKEVRRDLERPQRPTA